jgi:hypothetical protein
VKRSWVRAVARGLVGVVVMAQLAIAAYACPALSAATAANMAVSAPKALSDEPSAGKAGVPMADGANCDDIAGGSMDPSAPNLCAEHCKYGQQSDQAQTITVPIAVLTPLYAMPLVPEAAPPPRPAAAMMSALVTASPPHAILHCVFRI